MDAFDLIEPKTRKPRKKRPGLVWNILTGFVLLMVLGVAIVFLTVFFNPNIAFNPFPPPTDFPVPYFATATPSPRPLLPATWTPTNTTIPTITRSPFPTETPTLTGTPFHIGTPTKAGEKPQPETATPTPGGMPFVLKQGSPAALSSQAFRPSDGCNWMGVGGQVLDLKDAPVLGLIVQLGGVLQGKQLDPLNSITGTATQYNRGGFEFTISDHPIATNGTLWIQLMDQAGLPLSEKVYFNTFADCDKNLVIVYFKQVR